jgi:hypothetical protein
LHFSGLSHPPPNIIPIDRASFVFSVAGQEQFGTEKDSPTHKNGRYYRECIFENKLYVREILRAISMKVLIGLNRQGEKGYTKFPNDEEIMRCPDISSYKQHKTFSDSYGNKTELMTDIRQWYSIAFGIGVLDEEFFCEPQKKGYYIAMYGSTGFLGTYACFFVCDENQLTEEERSKLSA